MELNRLKACDALVEIQRYEAKGSKILGIEGFEIVDDGYIARLDLILDLSADPCAVARSHQLAEQFVRAHASENIEFEIIA